MPRHSPIRPSWCVQTPNPLVYISSATKNGYSIHNPSPRAPTRLASAFAAGATQSRWNPSGAPDFDAIRLDRGASKKSERQRNK
jgi:hypothetical protein